MASFARLRPIKVTAIIFLPSLLLLVLATYQPSKAQDTTATPSCPPSLTTPTFQPPTNTPSGQQVAPQPVTTATLTPSATDTTPCATATSTKHSTPTLIGSPGTRIPFVKEPTQRPTSTRTPTRTPSPTMSATTKSIHAFDELTSDTPTPTPPPACGDPISLTSVTTNIIDYPGTLSTNSVCVGDTFTFTLVAQAPGHNPFDGYFVTDKRVTLKITNVTNWTGGNGWQWFNPNGYGTGAPTVGEQQSTTGFAGNANAGGIVTFQVMSIDVDPVPNNVVRLTSGNTTNIANVGILSKTQVSVGDTFTFQILAQPAAPNYFDGIFSTDKRVTLQITDISADWLQSPGTGWQWFNPNGYGTGAPTVGEQQSTTGFAGNAHASGLVTFLVVSIDVDPVPDNVVRLTSGNTASIANVGILSKTQVTIGDTFTFQILAQPAAPNYFDGIFTADKHVELKITAVSDTWTHSPGSGWQWFDPANVGAGVPSVNAQQSTLGFAGNAHASGSVTFLVVSIPGYVTPTPSPTLTPSATLTPTPDPCDTPNNIASLDSRAACYGITFSVDVSAGGDSSVVWNDTRKQDVIDGAQHITTALSTLDLQPKLADKPGSFKAVFGSQELRLVGNNSGLPECGAVVDTPQVIKFNMGSTIGTITQNGETLSNTACINQYTATHELGHALRNRIKQGSNDPANDPAGDSGYLITNSIKYTYLDANGTQTVLIMGITQAAPFNGTWTRGQYGWNCDWNTYQQHPERKAPPDNSLIITDQAVRLDEGFADLFLSWTYNAFQDSICAGQPPASYPDFTPGTLRTNYMQKQLLPALVPFALSTQ